MTPNKLSYEGQHKRGKPLIPDKPKVPQKTVINGHYRLTEWNNKESDKSWKSTAKSASFLTKFNFKSYMTRGEAKKIKNILERQRGQEVSWKPLRKPSPTRDLEAHRTSITAIGSNSHRPITASPGSKGNTQKNYYKFYRTTLNDQNSKRQDITPDKSKKGRPQLNPNRSINYEPPRNASFSLIQKTAGKGKRVYPNKSNFDHSFTVMQRAKTPTLTRESSLSHSPLKARPHQIRNAFGSSLKGIPGFH